MSKNDLEAFLRPHLASGGLRYEKCRTLVLKSVGTCRELWIISERMKAISQKNEGSNPPPPTLKYTKCSVPYFKGLYRKSA